MFGCGSRKKSILKESTKTESKAETSGKTDTNFSAGSSSETDFSQFLLNNNLKITSDGNPYELQYGSFILKGSASIDFSQKKENIKQKIRYTDYIRITTVTTYKTRTQHNTETTYKSSKTERAGVTFGAIIWIVIAAMITGALLSTWLKSYLPKWRINLFNKKL
jgi:hypothetical protein